MPHRAVPVLVTFLALAAFGGPAAADIFVFHLSGDQEVPPTPSLATGGCHADFDAGTSELVFHCSHGIEVATLMHVHRAPAGANGPIVFDLGDPTSPVTATWTGMAPADVADLFAGNLYVNVHTAGRPDGEIRGQILPRTFDAVAFGMDGGQVVPSVGSPASGGCTADLNDPATAVDVECTHDVASPTAAHVHDAPFGQNGPAIFTFPSPTSPLSGSVPLTPAQVAELVAGFLYVDVHSTDAPDGEIRGQVADLPTAPTTGTITIRKETFPGGGAGFAFTDDVPGSPGTFVLDDGGAHVFTDVPAGTYTVAESDPSAEPGGHVLTHVECSDGDSAGDRFARTATVRVEAGEHVTCTFENLALAAGQPFVFGLDGSQEVPPVPSPATGGCMGFLDQPGASFTLVCTHDVEGPTLMHVHRGAAGENGPALFDLGDPASPVLATWTGMTPTDVADLLAGDLYVNIHTGGRPTGEIRGQILVRTHDTFAFPLEGGQQVPPVETDAEGSCTADLNDPADALLVTCVHTVADASAAHVHQAPPGENGPIRFHLPSPASPFSFTTPMTPRDVADLVAGFFYVNVHSPAWPDGEIRGQIVDGPVGGTPLEIPAAGGAALIALVIALLVAGATRLGR